MPPLVCGDNPASRRWGERPREPNRFFSSEIRFLKKNQNHRWTQILHFVSVSICVHLWFPSFSILKFIVLVGLSELETRKQKAEPRNLLPAIIGSH